MKTALLCLVVLVFAICIQADLLSLEQQWAQFKAKHGRGYANAEEEASRKTVFFNNLGRIHRYNREHPNGARMGINRFADLTVQEFRAVRQGMKKPMPQASAPLPKISNVGGYLCPVPTNLPTEWDWSDITPPQNQGQLGSSAIYSTLEALADGYSIQTGQVAAALSRQELLDCVGDDATPPQFFTFLAQEGGIDSEAAYPYTGEIGTCKAASIPKSDIVVKMNNWTMVIQGNETELACAVYRYQPISICLDADPLQFYESGIFMGDCPSNQIDDCMLLTGFGVQQKQQYWIIENSWGTDWGMDGFLWLARNDGNLCGVASYASFPSVTS